MLKLKTFKNMGILIIGRGFQVVAQIVTVRIATTLLSPQNMGSVTQMMSVSNFFLSAFISPISLYIGRGFLEWFEVGLLADYFKKFMKYVLITSLVVMVLTWLVQSQFILVGHVSPVWASLLVGIYLIAYSGTTTATSGLNLLGHRALFITFTNLQAWAGLGLATTLFLLSSQPVFWIFGQYLGIVISCISIFVLFRYLPTIAKKRTEPIGNTMELKRSVVLQFAWPQIVTLLLWWSQSQSYRFVLDRVSSLGKVGLFSVGYGLCAAPMIAVETLFHQFYDPFYYGALKGQKGNETVARAWNDYASAYIPTVILAGAFLIGSGPFLAKILLGEKFQSVSEFLIWPALTETIRAIGTTIHFMGIAKVDMRVTMLPVAVGAIIAPAGVYLFGGVHALQGTGIALFIASVGVLSTSIYISFKALPVRWPCRRIVYAILLGTPMIIGFKIINMLMLEINVLNAIIVLLLGGLYLIIAQYIMAKRWLKKIQLEEKVAV